MAQSIVGATADGTPIHAIDIGTGRLRAQILDYGAILRSFSHVDATGKRTELILGFDDVDAYLHDSANLGIIAGRYANRIAGAAFTLDDTRHELTPNQFPHHLHGGKLGFGRRHWRILSESEDRLCLGYHSPDGEEGYPGNVEVRAEFCIDDERLILVLQASTDAATPLNLTNHAYFNLAGDPAIPASAQWLKVLADGYLPVADSALLPTGKIASVQGTPFDLRRGRVLDEAGYHPQLDLAGGYDHYLVMSDNRAGAVLFSPHSRIRLTLSSNQPGLQVYDGNQLDALYPQLGRGICLEPTAYPDAPNRPGFPDAILRPGATYLNRIEYKVEKERK